MYIFHVFFYARNGRYSLVGSDPSTTVIESDFFYKLYRDFIKTCGGKSTAVIGDLLRY